MTGRAPTACRFTVGSNASPRHVEWANRLLLALFAAYFVWNSLYYAPYVVDDCFISLRYADNFVNGRGLVYNPSQHVEGYSNFSWVMLEALILLLGCPVVTGIKCLGLLSGLAVLMLTYYRER